MTAGGRSVLAAKPRAGKGAALTRLLGRRSDDRDPAETLPADRFSRAGGSGLQRTRHRQHRQAPQSLTARLAGQAPGMPCSAGERVTRHRRWPVPRPPLVQMMSDLNWAGPTRCAQARLVLGPFQGKPACVRIPVGGGVCGTVGAARRDRCWSRKNVHAFPGHIACESLSASRARELGRAVDRPRGRHRRYRSRWPSVAPARASTAADQAGIERVARDLACRLRRDDRAARSRQPS